MRQHESSRSLPQSRKDRTMTSLHFFQRYAQPENVATNNVLLLLRLIHQARRGAFESLMQGLLEDDSALAIDVGPTFHQQVRGPTRIADGLIRQRGFDLLIETKRGDSFDVDQAIGHLEQIRSSPNPVLLLLGRQPVDKAPSLARLFAAADSEPKVRVFVRSFKQLIDQCRAIAVADADLAALVDDFEGFCADSDLLPVDDYTLFVPPCGESFDDNLRYRLYYCPATRSRRLGHWFGVYREKCVHAIGAIHRVLDVSVRDGIVETPGATVEERERILGAIEAAKSRDWDLLEEPHTFYLFADLVPTMFVKDSPGGIPGHRYFDLRKLDLRKGETLSSELIARQLSSRRWSEWGQT